MVGRKEWIPAFSVGRPISGWQWSTATNLKLLRALNQNVSVKENQYNMNGKWIK